MDNMFALSNISEEAQQMLDKFWKRYAQSIRNTTTIDFKTQELPLARIKKIMKLDEDVKMIAGEAPVLFAKAVEIFIAELSLRAWINTEQNKRRTLQRSDIAMAIAKYDQFDFLIDIVPREEAKPMKKDDINNLSALDPYNNYYIQALPPGTQLLQASNQSPPFALSPQIFQVPVPSSSQNNRENRSQVSSPVPPLPITLSSQQYQALIQNQRQNSGQNQQEILLNQPTSFALSTNSGQVVQTIISTSSKATSNSTKVVINNKNKKKLS